MLYQYCYQSPLGTFCVSANTDVVVGLKFLPLGSSSLNTHELRANKLTNLCATQVLQYLSGKRYVFDFPYTLSGTDFQRTIWKACQLIPYGETRSYLQVAQLAGFENSHHAAGTALKQNPLQLIIPCHRVLKANSELGGYAGGAKLKQALLELERQHRDEWRS